jgi:hypothetical protein
MLSFRDTGTEAALQSGLAGVGAPYSIEDMALQELGEKK